MVGKLVGFAVGCLVGAAVGNATSAQQRTPAALMILGVHCIGYWKSEYEAPACVKTLVARLDVHCDDDHTRELSSMQPDPAPRSALSSEVVQSRAPRPAQAFTASSYMTAAGAQTPLITDSEHTL